MKVLGVNGGIDGYPSRFDGSHDAAAALVVDGEVVAACEEERLSREKHTGAFPRGAIAYCLREAGLGSVEEVDLVTYFHRHPLMFDREILRANLPEMRSAFGKVALFSTVNAMRAWQRLAGYTEARSRLVFERALDARIAPARFRAIKHHLCHVASAFYDSPFERALCFTVDGQGESSSSMGAIARGTSLEAIHETFTPNSLGYLYACLTRFLGFAFHDEYKVMGLAPYGRPDAFRSFFDKVVTRRAAGLTVVDPQLIGQLTIRDAFRAPGAGYPRWMLDALGPARRAGEPVEPRHMDIAASLQAALEGAVLHTLAHLRARTGERDLCMAGGVALNSSMNGRVARSGLFDRVWVQPAAHDAGTSLGAALYGYHNVLGRPRSAPRRRDPFLGPGFGAAEARAAIAAAGDAVSCAVPASPADPAALVEAVARALADGKIVGWCRGKSEWGPRALGHRSILADPRRDDMKDLVNHAVKLREGFRPFAPACLAERAADWFDLKGLPDSPYMLFVVPVREDRRARIPAVTHVDGSARVQTVSRDDDPRFHALLEAFERLTGVPVLLNTSFNVQGQAMVNTPAEALRCFLDTRIDLLVLDDFLVEKRPEAIAKESPDRARGAKDTGRVVDGRIAI